MKTMIRFSSIALLSIGLAFSSCKKSTDEIDDLDAGTELKQLSTDDNSAESQSESVMNDLNGVMESSQFGKGYSIHGASVDDSTDSGMRRIRVRFDGDNLDGILHRKGLATIQLIEGTKWSDAGAVIKIEFTNLLTTRKGNGRAVEFNGTFYCRNVSGGKVFVDPQVIHKFWGSGSMVFDKSGASRTWFINRKRTFENNSGVFTVKSEGDTTVDGNSNVIHWGITRNSTAFYTLVTTPVLVSSACPGGPVSGVKVHKGFAKDATVTFGVDQSGDPVTSGCPYGFKVEWTNRRNVARSAVISY